MRALDPMRALDTMRALSAMAACALWCGCGDNSRWTTAPGESYCGEVTAASFVRAGLPEGTRMRLELDGERLQVTPGRVWTKEFDSGERLSGAELRVPREVLHDPLSTLSFGEGRVRNALALIEVPSTVPAGRGTQLVAVVSLLQAGDVEVRLLRGAVTAAAGAEGGDETGAAEAGTSEAKGNGQLFGVFRLRRQAGDCGLP